MKELEINGETWIKKTHYEKLEKKKVKIIREEAQNIAPDNLYNTLCVIRYDDKEMIKHIFQENLPKEYFGELKFLNPEIEGDKPLRVVVRDSTYSYNYFIQANKIAEAFGYSSEDVVIHISDKKDQPILLNFNRISIIIAPRVNDTLSEQGEQDG